MNLRDYQNEVKLYCDKNGFNYDKVMSAIKGCGSDSIIFQIANKLKNKNGLLDETPLPTVLIMRKKENGNGVEFEQTEYTQKYLAI